MRLGVLGIGDRTLQRVAGVGYVDRMRWIPQTIAISVAVEGCLVTLGIAISGRFCACL